MVYRRRRTTDCFHGLIHRLIELWTDEPVEQWTVWHIWSISLNYGVVFSELWFVRHSVELRTIFTVCFTVIIELWTVSLT